MAMFFFCGVGGIGMSSIALYLKNKGHKVIGSDRSFDLGVNQKIKANLQKEGIKLVPQDGSGVTDKVDFFIVSTAVEDSIPDVKQALALGLTIKTRGKMLSEILNDTKSIAVAGTSGKTTTTAMVGHILATLKKDPTMINGGISINTYHKKDQSNLIFGKSDLFVAEADESNDTFEYYNPYISIIANISLDHKPLPEIRGMFERLIDRTKKGIVINLDCPETKKIRISHPNVISISTTGNKKATVWADKIKPAGNGVDFILNGVKAHLPLLGVYNVENALCAMSACLHLEIPLKDSLKALQSFLGTRRRLQTLGVQKGITVIDDYAHNPEKVRAAVTALKQYDGRLLIVFQPHGFAPLRLMKDGFIDTFNDVLDDKTVLIMPEVFYVGGTVAKDISSNDVVKALINKKKEAHYFEKRADIIPCIVDQLKSGDRVVIMGARDDTLTNFGEELLGALKCKK